MESSASDGSQPSNHLNHVQSISSQEPNRLRVGDGRDETAAIPEVKLVPVVGRTSEAWKHFKVYENSKEYAVCNYCNRKIKISGGTGHLLNHYRSCQADEIAAKKGIECITTAAIIHKSATIDAPASDEVQPSNQEHAQSTSSQDSKRLRIGDGLTLPDGQMEMPKMNLVAVVGRTSEAWKHFKVYESNNELAVCNYCNREIKTSGGSTGHLLNHYRTCQNKEINVKKKDENVKDVDRVDTNSSSKAQNGILNYDYVKTAPSFIPACTKWIALRKESLEIVEDPLFRQMCLSLNRKAPLLTVQDIQEQMALMEEGVDQGAVPLGISTLDQDEYGDLFVDIDETRVVMENGQIANDPTNIIDVPLPAAARPEPSALVRLGSLKE